MSVRIESKISQRSLRCKLQKFLNDHFCVLRTVLSLFKSKLCHFHRLWKASREIFGRKSHQISVSQVELLSIALCFSDHQRFERRNGISSSACPLFGRWRASDAISCTCRWRAVKGMI